MCINTLTTINVSYNYNNYNNNNSNIDFINKKVKDLEITNKY